MDNWKIQLVIMVFCALVQTFNGLSRSAEERRLSRDWQTESVDLDLSNSIENLMKRSKALRFYGLMGKRSVTKKPFQVNRRNKGEVFVGLMGRSVSSRGEQYHQETEESLTRVTPSATTAEIQVSEKPYRQSSQEEWEQILD